MNGIRTRSVQTLCILLIFTLFAAASLLLVLIGANVYRGVSARMDENDSIRTSLSYVANKVRTGDETGEIAVEDEGKIRSLVLSSRYDGDVYKTYLYWYRGWLTESFLAADQPFVPGDGEKITRLAGFSVKQTGRLLTVSATPNGGKPISISVCPRSS